MGVLGGLFGIAVVLMGLMFCGFYFITSETLTRLSRKRNHKAVDEKLTLLFAALEKEGFFNPQGQRVIHNSVLSAAIAETTQIEGFFWNICLRGIRIADNPVADAQYDHLLICHNNAIGFNWRGSN